jgi:predicted transcriptional regulator
MLVVETVARIRREHFVKGKTIKEIARDLGVSRNTVRKVLRNRNSQATLHLQPQGNLSHAGRRSSATAFSRTVSRLL